jgi:hypothetical protein
LVDTRKTAPRTQRTHTAHARRSARSKEVARGAWYQRIEFEGKLFVLDPHRQVFRGQLLVDGLQPLQLVRRILPRAARR